MIFLFRCGGILIWTHFFGGYLVIGLFDTMSMYLNIIKNQLGGGFKYFHPYLGKISILTNIFQRGWNHQPENQYPNPVGWQLVAIGSAVPPSLSPGRRCRRGHAGAARLAARRCWSSAATGGGPAIGVVVFFLNCKSERSVKDPRRYVNAEIYNYIQYIYIS